DLSIAALPRALFDRERGLGQQIEIFRRLFSGQYDLPTATQSAGSVVCDSRLDGGRFGARSDEDGGVLGGLGVGRNSHFGQSERGSSAAAGQPAGDWDILIGATLRSIWASSSQIDEVANVEKAGNRSGLRRLISATRHRRRDGHNISEKQIAAGS